MSELQSFCWLSGPKFVNETTNGTISNTNFFTILVKIWWTANKIEVALMIVTLKIFFPHFSRSKFSSCTQNLGLVWEMFKLYRFSLISKIYKLLISLTNMRLEFYLTIHSHGTIGLIHIWIRIRCRWKMTQLHIGSHYLFFLWFLTKNTFCGCNKL
jgi:hypothetical protein